MSAQVIVPFNSRYQVIQKGNLVFVSNSILSCDGSAAGCTLAQNEIPPAGTGSNASFTMQYIDVDSDPLTFSSSSADLALPACSQVTFAGLYWGASINGSTPNYAGRNSILLKVPGASGYSSMNADTLIDNTTGSSTYHCFKDVTSQVAAGGNGTYTVADFVAANGSTGNFGGWTIVVVFKNENQSIKQLTVFDGLFNANSSNSLTRSISGFTTASTGNINLEVGVVSYSGSRNASGDSLLFNDAIGSWVPLKDAPNPEYNIFNSSISYHGLPVSSRIPAYTNTLGYDADLFVADNATKNYLSNNQTSASIKIISAGEPVLTQVLSSSLEVSMPRIGLIKSFTDLNGGTLDAGDTIAYTFSIFNDGGGSSTATYVMDTISSKMSYIPGSLEITSGPNSGIKTDASGDDQAEYLANKKIIYFRLGTAASAVKGGSIPATGIPVSTATFKVKVTDQCEALLCDNQVSNQAYTYCRASTGSTYYGFSSQPPGTDANGCQLTGPTVFDVTIPTSCTFSRDTSVAACAPYSFSSLNSVYPGFSYYNTSFVKVTGASSSGIFYGIKAVTPTCIDTFLINYMSNNPTISGNTIIQPTCTNGGANAGQIRLKGLQPTDSIAYNIGYSYTGGPFTLGSSYVPSYTLTGLNQNIYTIRVKSNTNCYINRTISISYINCTPVASDEYYTILATDILDNDVSLNDNEPDADPMTFTVVSPPAYGALVFNPDGSFTYTPDANYRGAVTFTYRAADNRSPSLGSNAVVHITIVSPLPVELTSFSTHLDKSQVVVDWQTASELNNDHFEVERSNSSTEGFRKLADIKGNNTSNLVHNYSFTDLHPLAGRSYYRLKQVDQNNDFTYSKISSVDNGTILSQEIIPNPNNGIFKLHLNSNSTGSAFISIVSQYGQRCYNEEIQMEGNFIKEINLKDKARGVYYVILNQNETLSKLKFVIQ